MQPSIVAKPVASLRVASLAVLSPRSWMILWLVTSTPLATPATTMLTIGQTRAWCPIPMVASKRTLMCIGPVSLAAFDAAITLVGQSPDYWDGYATVREHNPLAYLLLRFHPLVFAIGIAIWMVLFITAIHLLPIEIARIAAFTVLLGHALGASTWLLQCRFGVLYVLALFLLARSLDSFIWDQGTQKKTRRVGDSNPSANNPRPQGESPPGAPAVGRT